MKHLDLKLSPWEEALNKVIKLDWVDGIIRKIKHYHEIKKDHINRIDQEQLETLLAKLLEFSNVLKVAQHMWEQQYNHSLMDIIILCHPPWVTDKIVYLTFQVIIRSTDRSPKGRITQLPHIQKVLANPSLLPNFFHEDMLTPWIRANQMLLEECFYDNELDVHPSMFQHAIHFQSTHSSISRHHFPSLIDLLVFIVRFNQMVNIKSETFGFLLLIVEYLQQREPSIIPDIIQQRGGPKQQYKPNFPILVDELVKAVLTNPFVHEGSDCLYAYFQHLSSDNWCHWINHSGHGLLVTMMSAFSYATEEEDTPFAIFLWAFLKTLYFQSLKCLPDTSSFHQECLNLYPVLNSLVQHQHTISRVDPTAASHYTPLLNHMHHSLQPTSPTPTTPSSLVG